MMNSSRSIYIDNLKGTLIFLIVFGHFFAGFITGNTIFTAFYTLIYSFHIPLFVFVSGFLSKNAEKQRDAAFANFLGLYLFSVICYTFFSDVLYLFVNWSSAQPSVIDKIISIIKDSVLSVFTATGPAWYLLSLIVWRLITPYFKKKRFIFIALLVALAVGGVQQIGFALSLSRTLVFFPFYLLGFHFDGALFDKVQLRKNMLYIIIPALVLVGIFILMQQNILRFKFEMLYAYTSYHDCGYSFLKGAFVRTVIILTASLISICFLLLIPQKIAFIKAWGSQSLNIYIWHIFFIPVFEIFSKTLNIPLLFVPIVIAATLAACFVFSSIFFESLTVAIKRKMNSILFGDMSIKSL